MRYHSRVTVFLFRQGWERWRTRAACLLAGCFCSLSLRAAVTVTAVLNPPQAVNMGGRAALQIIVQDGTPDLAPQLPPLGDFRVGEAGSSSQFELNGTQQSVRFTYSYQLEPLRPGKFLIQSATVMVGGVPYYTQPLTLQVLPPNAPAPGGNPAVQKEAFLKLAAPRGRVYVGEPFLLDVKLYAMTGQLREEPQLTDAGLVVGKLVKLPTGNEVFQNRNYNEITYRRMVIATKPGKTRIGPATMVFGLPRTRTSFFDDPYVSTTLVSEPLDLQVLPLPVTNTPANFAGAVGNFIVRFWASPTNVAVGDPITVHVQIAGRGAFDSLTLPEQPEWREFKVYPATSQSMAADEYGLAGTNNFEQVVVPQNAEIKRLPGLEFSFFNPDAGQYRTIRMPSLPLLVRPSAATPQPSLSLSNIPATSPPPPATEIVHIKPDLGAVARIAPPLILRGWFLALQLVAPLVWLALVFRRWRQRSVAGNPRLRRRRQVALMIKETLPELARLAAAGAVEDFHAAAFRLLQEKLGECLDLPAGSITEEVIDERLRQAGAGETLLARLRELFQVLNRARFAPQSSPGGLAALLPAIEDVLVELEGVKA
jgi:hypothetical protein